MGTCMYMWVTLSSYTLHACKIEDIQRSTTFSYINNNKNFILQNYTLNMSLWIGL